MLMQKLFASIIITVWPGCDKALAHPWQDLTQHIILNAT